MSRKLLCVGAAITTILFGGLVSGGDAPPADVKKENAELRQQVQRLQAEVDALTTELRAARAAQAKAMLEQIERIKRESATRDQLPRRYSTAPTTQPFVMPPTTELLPKGTIEQEFNGAPVYLIPLGAK